MKKSHIIAIIFTASIVLWMGAGMLFKDPVQEQKAALQQERKKPAADLVVEVRAQTAEAVIGHITAQGNVTPDREVTLRAEAAAQVKEILIKEGNPVKSGEVLAKLDIDDRQAQLDRARAKTAEAQRKYTSYKNLGEKGYTAQTRVDEALATLRAAQAEEKQLALAIGDTAIKAPFDGIIDTQHIEEGDYVNVGDNLFIIVDNDPLVIDTYIPQQDIVGVKLEDKAGIKLATGQTTEGTIRYIAPRADETTRTFRVEIAMDNAEGLPSGISATVKIPKQSVMAHFVSPAVLALDENGDIGVKTVNEDRIVEFYPVEIVNAAPSGVYVTGLPESAKIISNGQGFVSAGEKVEVSITKAEMEPSMDAPEQINPPADAPAENAE